MTKLLDIVNGAWAIQPEKLVEIQAIYCTHLRGEKIDLQAVEAALGRPLNNESRGYDIVDGVAVIPIEGVVAKRMNLMSQISGGTSSDIAGRNLDQAMRDPAVHSVIQYIDSPGGTVDGSQAYAEKAFAYRGTKPLITLASGTMASAAYWMGAAADEIYITDLTTVVGSIGIVAKHVDTSGAESKAGIKTTEITAGKYKRAASQYEPLSQEGRQVMQDQVDYTYAVMVDDIAKYRGVTSDKVLADMADGRVFIGQQAIDAGLVDGVSTLDALVAKLNADRVSAASGAGAAHSTQPSQGQDSMDKDKLKAEHPAVYEAVLALGVAQGATAERERIQGIEAQAMPGFEAVINPLKFDGKSTAGDAAQAILKAQRDQLAAAKDGNNKDAPNALPGGAQAAAGEGDKGPKVAPTKVPDGFSGVDEKSAQLDAKARAYMAEHPGTTYLAAVKAVQQQGA